MTETETGNAARSSGKTVLSLIAGGVIGFAAIMLVDVVLGEAFVRSLGASRLALGGIGIIWLLIAVICALGLLMPNAGARVLNVADADELRERRRVLTLSAAITGAYGVMLLMLAVAAGPQFAAGVVPAGTAMAVLLLVTAGSAWASWQYRALYDELDRQLAIESAGWAFMLGWVAMTIWAAGDFLGFGLRLTPIDVVSAFPVLMLLGAFAAIGRRGMMTR